MVISAAAAPAAAAAAAAAAACPLLLLLHALVVAMLSQNQGQPSGTHSFVLNQNPIAKHTIHVSADAAFPIIPSPSMQRLNLTPPHAYAVEKLLQFRFSVIILLKNSLLIIILDDSLASAAAAAAVPAAGMRKEALTWSTSAWWINVPPLLLQLLFQTPSDAARFLSDRTSRTCTLHCPVGWLFHFKGLTPIQHPPTEWWRVNYFRLHSIHASTQSIHGSWQRPNQKGDRMDRGWRGAPHWPLRKKFVFSVLNCAVMLMHHLNLIWNFLEMFIKSHHLRMCSQFVIMLFE